VLAYSSPDLSHNGKLIYAAVTYTLLTLLYTVVNIPYCALGGVITDNPTQRISCSPGASCWRRRAACSPPC
jgi:GPH family glycoside/pentoside/hexuronide:cation symporter